MFNKVYKDIKSLYNSDVNIFGQATKLDDYNTNYYISVLDILDSLRDYSVNDSLANKIINAYDDDAIEVISRHNTYNYGSNLDHDIEYYEIKYNDRYYIMLSIHRYGDVRSNYSNYIVLNMTLDEFYYTIDDMYKLDSVEIDGVNYNLLIRPLSDNIEISDSDGVEIGSISEYDYNDAINSIKDLIKGIN